MNEQILERSGCEQIDHMVLSRYRLSKLFDSETMEYLENCTVEYDCMPYQQGVDDMATKITRAVYINGSKRWIRANTEQEYADKIIKLYEEERTPSQHSFSEYAWNWFNLYSLPNVATVTATTYRRQLTKYLIPFFGKKAVEDITIDDVQRLFNGIEGTKATKDKVRTVLDMILAMAVEDDLLAKNPLKSKRLRITGKASKATPPYEVSEMQYFVDSLDKIKGQQDRMYFALQVLHPMRLEEILGLQWGDIDPVNMEIHIQRAVTHPDRNQPEVKQLKTEASMRCIRLSDIAARYLTPGQPNEFVVGGKPLSYSQVRKMCGRIQREIGFDGKITPIRFRTTVLTDQYDQSHDIKAVQAAAGHATADMTLKHYVKGRKKENSAPYVPDELYGRKVAGICTPIAPQGACQPA